MHTLPRTLCLLGTLTLSALLPGCGGYSIREGIWELRIDDFTRVENGQTIDIQPWTVKVSVAKFQDPSGRDLEHIEDVEIVPLPSAAEASQDKSGEQPRPNMPRLPRPSFYADIRRKEEGPTIFVVQKASDESWVFQMSGVVKDSKTIVGQRLFGRILYTSDASFQGHWSMRWLRDE